MVLLLNFAHPLTDAQLAEVSALLGARPDVRMIPTHVDRTQPVAVAARALADAAGLPPDEWQTRPLVINPPGLAPLALALLADIHGRCGYFPPAIHIRPVAGALPPRYEVAEIVDLQQLRDSARGRRYPAAPAGGEAGAAGP
ncbi:MAG TPA: CRISPR-associated protein Csx15 [Chloroflexia bacterium]|nr:CRISPR-associated protein Csx15 [Chloroflexia bacterium]